MNIDIYIYIKYNKSIRKGEQLCLLFKFSPDSNGSPYKSVHPIQEDTVPDSEGRLLL